MIASWLAINEWWPYLVVPTFWLVWILLLRVGGK
jgi:hypothetical protein